MLTEENATGYDKVTEIASNYLQLTVYLPSENTGHGLHREKQIYRDISQEPND